MHDRSVEVVGPDGARGSVDAAQLPRGGADGRIRVVFEGGGERMVSPSDLRPLPDGRYEIGGDDASEVRVVPVVEERARVTTRAEDQGGVRISKSVRERRETVDPPLAHEEVLVERVAMHREVSGPLPVREEDGQIIVPLVEEVLVVRKAWVLREEVRISKRRFNVHRPATVTLRAEHAEVEPLPPEGPGAGGGGADRDGTGPATEGGGGPAS